jgi:hypothetical protein
VIQISTENDMKGLHTTLLKLLQNILENDSEKLVTPAMLNVARQFLKDNNINCDGRVNDDFSRLVDLLPELPEWEGGK